MKVKEPVRLRQKKLSDGSISLYLDIYYNSVRKYEFLKLYLIPEKAKKDKDVNKTTLAIANSIKAKRIIDIQSGAYDVKLASREDVFFFTYFDNMCNQLESRKSTLWQAVKVMITKYSNDADLKFKHVDANFVKGFRSYLDNETGLAQGSKHVYFAIFKAVLNQALKDGIIDRSPASNVQGFKPSEPKRIYLTAEEVKMMAGAKCSNENVKRAFLFSCLTGLRLSDIIALTWGDVTEENGYTRITFRQQKTKFQEYLDINKQAVTLMGERSDAGTNIFKLPATYYNINLNIDVWAKNAGISKHITFHVARHTFATMMLSNGVDLYTVSKLVGHRDISTTQIYAKVMDKEKQQAIDKMPELL